MGAKGMHFKSNKFIGLGIYDLIGLRARLGL